MLLRSHACDDDVYKAIIRMHDINNNLAACSSSSSFQIRQSGLQKSFNDFSFYYCDI